MPTADRADAGASQNTTPGAPQSSKDDLATVLGAAAEAGAQANTGDTGGIAADDAGGSKLATEIDRRGKLPKSDPPGEGQP